MKRTAHPPLSSAGQEALASYECWLREREDLTVASIRNYLSDLRHFIIVLLLHAGLRAREICHLRRDQVKLGKSSGFLEIMGKRNTYREVPLNAKARNMLEEYLPTLPPDAVFLFPSGKTKEALSERALGYIVKKYAASARLHDVSPHDLRHRFGYRMAESVPLHRLAQIMGHGSLDTTKLYIQGTKHVLQQAVETIAWT
jgi:integrase/recombinase XerC